MVSYVFYAGNEPHEEEPAMKKRLLWADQAKGFEILLIFVAHFLLDEIGRSSLLVQLMTLSGLTVFYFTSGYFCKGQFNLKQWLKHHAYTLLLPYLVASLVFWVMHYAMGNQGNLDRFLGIFLQLPDTPWEGGRWFVPCFFVAKLVFDFTASRFKGNAWGLLALCFGYAAVAWIYTLLGGPRLPWNIEAALFAQPFFAMGCVWKQGMEQRYEAITVGKKAAIILGAVVACLALAALNLKIGGRTADYHSRVLNEFFTAYGASACALFLILRISMKNNKFLAFLGRNSLVYYMYTGLAGAVTSRITDMMGWNHWAARFAVGFVGFLLLIGLMAIIMNRFFPWAVGKPCKK